MVAATSAWSALPPANRPGSGASSAKAPLCAKACIRPRVRSASPPSSSSSSRSKLLATWMSIDGLVVAVTVPRAYRPVATNRARMSFSLVAITSRSTGSPIAAATRPA